MITKLYDEYFQKSQVFLLPMIQIYDEKIFTPSATYLAWLGRFEPEDHRLMVVYDDILPDNEEWFHFMLRMEGHANYQSLHYCTKKKQAILVFDLTEVKETFDLVLQGRYSQIKSIQQTHVMVAFGAKSPEWAYIETFFKPQKYMKIYADLLEVPEDLLNSIGELCDKPDLQKETLMLKTDLNNVKLV